MPFFASLLSCLCSPFTHQPRPAHLNYRPTRTARPAQSKMPPRSRSSSPSTPIHRRPSISPEPDDPNPSDPNPNGIHTSIFGPFRANDPNNYSTRTQHTPIEPTSTPIAEYYKRQAAREHASAETAAPHDDHVSPRSSVVSSLRSSLDFTRLDAGESAQGPQPGSGKGVSGSNSTGPTAKSTTTSSTSPFAQDAGLETTEYSGGFSGGDSGGSPRRDSGGCGSSWGAL